MPNIAQADRMAMNSLFRKEMGRFGKIANADAFKDHSEYMAVLAAAVEDPDAVRDHKEDQETLEKVTAEDKKTKGDFNPNEPLKD